MPIGNTDIPIQVNISEFIMNLIVIMFCEFNRVESWNKDKTTIFVDPNFKYANLKYRIHINVKVYQM